MWKNLFTKDVKLKLRAKFSLLIVLLTFVMIAVSCYLLLNFLHISKVYRFQTELQQTRYNFQNILTYSDRVRSRGIDVDTIYTHWTEILTTLDANFKILDEDDVRKKLNTDSVELVENCLSSWKGMRPEMDIISTHYKSISEMDFSFMVKNTIRSSGITNAIQNYRDSEDLTRLEYEMSALETNLALVDFVYENFNTTFDKITLELSDHVKDTQTRFFTFAIIISIFSAIIVMVLAVLLMSGLMGRFNKIQVMTTKLSERDLTFKADEKSNDEAGVLVQQINDTIGVLNDFFVVVKKTAENAKIFGQDINASAMETATATHEINSNIESLGRQFVFMDEAVNKTVGSLQDMSSMVSILLRDNEMQSGLLNDSSIAIDEIAKTIDDVSNKAKEKAAAAAEIQNLVLDGDEKMDAASKLLGDITAQLDEIGEVINLINSIAEQTNILSMNAAIESAHAGEAGKGFSVVAEEIRMLAESTSENANRISGAIYGIVNNMHLANKTNLEASTAFQRVSDHAKDMMKSLQEITEGVENVDSRAKQITVQTRKLSNSAGEINSYCGKLNMQQAVVSGEMEKMRSIFTESLQGMDEIKVGTTDISRRMTEISDFSRESCDKMEELGAALDEFKTQDNSYDVPSFDELVQSDDVGNLEEI